MFFNLVLVQNPETCTFCRYISIFPASTHSKNQQHHSTTLLLYHLNTAKIERCGFIKGWPIIVREIVILIYIVWIQQSWEINYCNQPVLDIVLDLNVTYSAL